MRMLRNKGAHLGLRVFRHVGLHDSDFRFYIFLPRQWPYIWEKRIKPHDPAVKPDQGLIQKQFRDELINQDTVDFTHGLYSKVLKVVSACAGAALKMYRDFADYEVNEAAIAELNANSMTYKFEYFSTKWCNEY